jgi:hypothetical protein
MMMQGSEFAVSLPAGSTIEAVDIAEGRRKGYDTLVNVRVGPIIIIGVEVIDDHQGQAEAHLPAGVSVLDAEIEAKIKSAALAHHYGVDDLGSSRK